MATSQEGSVMDRESIHAHATQEALRFKWIESEKAGVDLGEVAIRRWVREHWWDFLTARWIEHLQGERYWIELDRKDFGLLQREFLDQPVLLDRVLDRLKAGWQNLDILLWATEWGIPRDPLVEILMALDFNGRRLVNRLDPLDAPRVKLDQSWLTWNGGTIPRLAWGIALEGDLDTLPILGDALEEAGCTDREVLEHCRAAGRDMRWSWVVDLILEHSWPLRYEKRLLS
jgi:hypothetical protein